MELASVSIVCKIAVIVSRAWDPPRATQRISGHGPVACEAQRERGRLLADCTICGAAFPRYVHPSTEAGSLIIAGVVLFTVCRVQ